MNTHHDPFERAKRARQSKQNSRVARGLWLLVCLTFGLTISAVLRPAAQAFQNPREVRVANTAALPGAEVTVALELLAQGNESTVQFSLTFNNAILTNPRVVRGSAVPTAPTVNSNQAANGRLGLFIELPQGQVFAAGVRQLATVTFTIPANAPSGATPIEFGEQPIAREIGDLNFSVLTAAFTAGAVGVLAPVESPDRLNLFNGVVTLDQEGQAEVVLPDYFGTLHRDFRYQLTCLGGFAPIYIAQKITANRFRIAGGTPGLEVSWQVTGIRQDTFASPAPTPTPTPNPD